MFNKKRLYFPLVALIVAALACNLPGADAQQGSGPNAAFTSAAQTVEVKLTEAAQTQAAPGSSATDTPVQAATSTPNPTTAVTSTTAAGTATSAQTCDRAQFITDVTVADGTNFSANATFTKTWRIKNTGTCAWTTSYALAFGSGNSMSGPGSVGLAGNVNPGETVDISVNMAAPASPGSYTGYWKLRNAAGVSFLTVTVVIQVGGGGGGAFAVNHVEFSVSGSCGAFHVTAAVQVNAPGTVTYHWVWSDGGSDGTSHAPLVFSAAGTQSVTTDWSVSASGSNWIDIYIDSPNHQQIGRATLTCP